MGQAEKSRKLFFLFCNNISVSVLGNYYHSWTQNSPDIPGTLGDQWWSLFLYIRLKLYCTKTSASVWLRRSYAGFSITIESLLLKPPKCVYYWNGFFQSCCAVLINLFYWQCKIFENCSRHLISLSLPNLSCLGRTYLYAFIKNYYFYPVQVLLKNDKMYICTVFQDWRHVSVSKIKHSENVWRNLRRKFF